MKILSLSGFVPEHICDTVRFTRFNGDRNIKGYCGYLSDFISQVLNDDTIDGAVFPKSCDSSRVAASYLSQSGKFLYRLPVPAYGAPQSEEFFASAIRDYLEATENHYGIEITDIPERCERLNARNSDLKTTYENIDGLVYSDYLKTLHNMLKLPLAEQRVEKPAANHTSGKRVFLVGSFLANTKIAEYIEDAGLVIAGDTLPESGRLAHTAPVDTSGDIYLNIAKSMLSQRPSPTRGGFSDMMARDIAEIKKKDVDGVIFLTQKFCEPYDCLYPVYKRKLDDLGIKSLKLAFSDTADTGKAALSVEAFADIL